MRRTFLLLALVVPISAELTWQKPPKEVLDILNAPATPVLSVNPLRTYAALSEAHRYPSIAEVSEPMLRLAGRATGIFEPSATRTSVIAKLPPARCSPFVRGSIRNPANRSIGSDTSAMDG
jgi:hypothetical protein